MRFLNALLNIDSFSFTRIQKKIINELCDVCNIYVIPSIWLSKGPQISFVFFRDFVQIAHNLWINQLDPPFLMLFHVYICISPSLKISQ